MKRKGIAGKTADAVEAWLESEGMALQAEKKKAPKPSARPFTDAWGAIFEVRRRTRYNFSPWWQSSRDALALADACGGDVETFRRVCERFHDLEDEGTWSRAPTLSKCLYQVAELLNAAPKRTRGEYVPMSPEQKKRNKERREMLMEERRKRAAETPKEMR